MYIYNNLKPTLAAAWEVLQLEDKTLNIIEVTELKDLNKGEYFKLKPDSKKVYIKGEYLRDEKRFSCIDFEDINKERFLKPTTVIWTQFEF